MSLFLSNLCARHFAKKQDSLPDRRKPAGVPRYIQDCTIVQQPRMAWSGVARGL